MTDPTHDLQALLSKIELFLDDLGSTSDESLEEADPALLGAYRDDAAKLRDALTSLRASRPPEERELRRKVERYRQMLARGEAGSQDERTRSLIAAQERAIRQLGEYLDGDTEVAEMVDFYAPAPTEGAPK